MIALTYVVQVLGYLGIVLGLVLLVTTSPRPSDHESEGCAQGVPD